MEAPLSRAALVALVSFVISACGAAPPLVRLEAPDVSAPRTEREAAYCALAVEERRAGAAVHWAGSDTVRQDEGAILAGGQEITHVDDLGAVLNPRSKAFRALRQRQAADGDSALLIGIGTGLGVGVLGGLVWSMVEDHPDGALWGWAVGGGLTVLLLTTGIRSRMAMDEHLGEAWLTYDESLRATLFEEAEEPPHCGDESDLPPPAPEEKVWKLVTWDLDVDFNMGRIWEGRNRAAFFGRARAGIAVIHDAWMMSVGPTVGVSNVTALQLGGEVEATHITSGFWGQLGGFGDVHDRFGARAATGWSILGTEVMLRVDKHKKATVGWFLKVRVPVSFFVNVAD